MARPQDEPGGLPCRERRGLDVARRPSRRDSLSTELPRVSTRHASPLAGAFTCAGPGASRLHVITLVCGALLSRAVRARCVKPFTLPRHRRCSTIGAALSRTGVATVDPEMEERDAVPRLSEIYSPVSGLPSASFHALPFLFSLLRSVTCICPNSALLTPANRCRNSS